MASFGEMLRRERELRRVSLREVAEGTKINIRYLEALERNDFGYLPGGAFNKGFIRAYARCIGVDDREMIDAYLYEVAEQDAAAEGAGQALGVDRLQRHFRLPERHEGARRRRARILVLAAATALLLALLAGTAWGAYKLLAPGADRGPSAPVNEGGSS
ncbi:MAG: helix-turn-helix domain-containing protein [Acidobacteriota bacterium]|nr:helix-turn-helix domain-containing protein [Acidobacteriota bacterium]